MSISKRILIVDDEAGIRQILSDFVNLLGYEAHVATDGFGALRAMAGERFDLVITDIVMPGMGGMELIREIEKRHPDTPVVIIAAYNRFKELREFEDLPVAGFVEKPFRIEEIEETVLRALSRGQHGTSGP